jgi:hypothetical protein
LGRAQVSVTLQAERCPLITLEISAIWDQWLARPYGRRQKSAILSWSRRRSRQPIGQS